VKEVVGERRLARRVDRLVVPAGDERTQLDALRDRRRDRRTVLEVETHEIGLPDRPVPVV
jgi:hypothetical protein